MTDNAKALADHIRSDLTYITGLADHMEAGGDVSKKNIGNLIAMVRWNAEHHLECRDIIETQAREIERLRETLGQIAPHVNWMPHPHCLTVEQLIRAALGDSHDQ